MKAKETTLSYYIKRDLNEPLRDKGSSAYISILIINQEDQGLPHPFVYILFEEVNSLEKY
jgi:hypothetical protein